MKTDREVKDRLSLELEQWFIKQCRDNTKDYYLYYCEQCSERDGGFLFCSKKPANPACKLGWNQRVNKGFTVEQNFNVFYPVLRTLPILTV